MQSKNEEKDEELVNRVNQLINDPQSAAHDGNSRDGDLEFEGNAHSDLMQILGGGANGQGDLDMNMTQDNLLQFIQNAGGLGWVVHLDKYLWVYSKQFFLCSNLSSALPGNVVPDSHWSNLKTKLTQVTVPEGQAAIDVHDVLETEELEAILADSDIRSALFPFVSESSDRTQAEIEQLIQSEPFQQRLQLLSTAIQQDTLDAILEDLDSEKSKSK